LSEENQEIDNEIPSEVDVGPDDESGPSVFEHNLLAGRVYTHANDSRFTVFVTRGLNQKARFSPPQESGVELIWEATPPTDMDLLQVVEQTGSPAHEYSFTPSAATIFIPSPQPLSQDLSQIKKTLVPNTAKFRWLVLTIPFKVEMPGTVAEMDSFPTE
jgi:hypothetical protein